jgi:hypothetical protein
LWTLLGFIVSPRASSYQENRRSDASAGHEADTTRQSADIADRHARPEAPPVPALRRFPTMEMLPR